MMLKGYVCLIGAGPGNPGLITCRGLAYLQRAEVVLYDHLIPAQLLLKTRPDCELLDVGKSCGRPSVSQEEINALMIAKAKAGRFVVRLKGGDPFLLGRGGEEAQSLADAGVPYIVVPGISSSYAVPAYAGIPVTDRRFSSEMLIATGHKALEQASGGRTRVILMALAQIEAVAAELISQGVPEDTPVCLISKGTTAGQRTVRGVLRDIAARAQAAGLAAPALLVVGAVCQLAGALDWRGNLPLAGKRILWTRPQLKEEPPLLEELELYGAEIVRLPMMTIQPTASEQLVKWLPEIGCHAWVVFTSATAVEIFFHTLLQAGKDWRFLGRARIAVIGTKTGQALRKRGRTPDLVAEEANGYGLLSALQKQLAPAESVALCRARQTLPTLAAGLQNGGIPFKEYVLYEIKPPEYPARLVQEIFAEPFDVVIFTSPLAVEHFCRIIQEVAIDPGQETRFACIGKETAAALGKYHRQPWVIANQPNTAGLLQQILTEWGLLDDVSNHSFTKVAPEC